MPGATVPWVTCTTGRPAARLRGTRGIGAGIVIDGRRYDIACCQIDVGNAMTELAARIPLDLKLRNGVGKHIIRELLYRHVPRELFDAAIARLRSGDATMNPY